TCLISKKNIIEAKVKDQVVEDLDAKKKETLQVKANELRRWYAMHQAPCQEICRDLKKLDFAKKHITTTVQPPSSYYARSALYYDLQLDSTANI
ncbi:vacuolar protein sorting-associated protein 53 A, partial [Tanacetum coccineum]